MTSPRIHSNDEATQRMLNAFHDATSTTTSAIKQVMDMQSQIPTFWQGDAASTFANSVGVWLDGANKINVGLQDLQDTMSTVQSKSMATEQGNTRLASIPAGITY